MYHCLYSLYFSFDVVINYKDMIIEEDLSALEIYLRKELNKYIEENIFNFILVVEKDQSIKVLSDIENTCSFLSELCKYDSVNKNINFRCVSRVGFYQSIEFDEVKLRQIINQKFGQRSVVENIKIDQCKLGRYEGEFIDFIAQ